MIFRPFPRFVGPMSAPPPFAIAKVASIKLSSCPARHAREVRWRCQSGLGAEPRSDTKSETGDAPFCNSDNTAAACATAPRCSKSTTSLQGFSATEPASDQGAPQKCSLPENDAGYAPNPNRAVESSNTYSPSATTSNFEIGSSLPVDIFTKCL